MKIPRRQFLHLATGAVALPAVSRMARAQAYPTRPVRIVAPYAAGGGSDILARLMGQWLSERLAQQFIVREGPLRPPRPAPPRPAAGDRAGRTRPGCRPAPSSGPAGAS
jgi:hypothetical protein